MKKILVIACVISICAMMFIPASAAGASSEILRGTPTVDAEMDSMYLESLCIEITPELATWSYLDGYNIELLSYFLYDDDYLYIYYTGTDDDIIPADDALISGDAVTYNPWQNDNIETRVDFGNGMIWVLANFSSYYDHVFTDESSNFDPYTCKLAGKVEGDTFYLELAIPMSLKAGNKIGLQTQIDDRFSADDPNTAAFSLLAQTELTDYKLSEKSAVPEEPETEAIETEAVAVETQDKGQEAAAPQTFDSIIISAAIAIPAICVGLLNIKRKTK